MSKRITETQILEHLDAYGAHADDLSDGPLSAIFAYRVFDLRDHFPAPYPEFRQALEALQSDRAYLPEMSGQIVVYCRDGRSLEIPHHFFIRSESRFKNRAAAEQWVLDRMHAIERGESFAHVQGIALANPDDSIEKQIKDALAWQDQRLADPLDNDGICACVEGWLLKQLESSY